MANKTCFPEDLVEEILVKMPIKSILRCKVLSKHYYSLIRSQCFTLRHLRLAKLNKNKMFDGSFLSTLLDSVHLFEPGGHTKVLQRIPCIVEGSSNVEGHPSIIHSICGPLDGLYCVLEINKIVSSRRGLINKIVSSRRRLTVWNPATREDFILPHPKHNDIFGYKSSPKSSMDDLGIHAFGFGHGSNKNNYKVVIIYAHISDRFDKKLYFYVFDLSEGEGRIHEEGFVVDPWFIESNAGVFIRGCCHWVCLPPRRGNTASGIYVGYAILAFDMSRETHSLFSLPDCVVDETKWSFDISIATLDGCLALTNTLGLNLLGRCPGFNVWVMAEYGVIESWKLLYRVSLSPGTYGSFLGIIGDRFYVAEEEGWLVSYDLRSEDYEGCNILDSNIDHIVPYEESLVRVITS